MKIRDLTNQKFERLTALRRLGPYKHGGSLWECACDCGAITQVKNQYLTSGHTTSCGCIRYEKLRASHIIHGLSDHPLHHVWRAMISRCFCPTDSSYHKYGGRGISVCERWRESFVDFLSDMGERPSKGQSLDRFPNNNGNYEPGNVRWATQKEQCRNTRRTLKFTWRGALKSLSDICDSVGVSRNKIYNRLHRGWSLERAMKKEGVCE